jgi:hypothetical protein
MPLARDMFALAPIQGRNSLLAGNLAGNFRKNGA